MNDILLRLVNADDAVALWRWRNDLETRRNSISTAELSLQEHMTWFEASLTNPARVIYVSEIHGEKCGSIRFDLIDTDKKLWRVSIMMSPEFRGRGLGNASLSLACAEMVRCYSDCSFTAEARRFNAPSLRIFERCGFSPTSATDDFITLSRVAS
jgi:RimJ/RimL family protein N-acetyltransferase